MIAGELPVIVAAGYPWVSEGLQVGELARRHPETTIVATNGAQINISGLGQQDAELALEASPNLFIQTTRRLPRGLHRGRRLPLRRRASALRERLPALRPALELLRVRWAPNLDETAKAAMLGGNAARLFSL